MTHLALDPDGRIDDDLHCARCGQALRGVAGDGVCPECEHSIAWTLEHGLHSAPVRWLRRLRLGCLLLMLFCILMLVRQTWYVILSYSGPVATSNAWIWLYRFDQYNGPIATILGLIGMLMVTSRQPGRREPPVVHGLRLVLPLLFALSTLVQWWDTLFIVLPASETLETITAVVYSGWMMYAPWVLFLPAMALYTQSIAMRIPNPRLARAVGILCGILLLIVAVFAIASISSATFTTTTYEVVLLAQLVIIAAFIVLLGWTRRVLRRAIRRHGLSS